MVPPSSHRVSRVRRYSGYSWLSSSFAYVTLTLFGKPSHVFPLDYLNAVCCPNPNGISTAVWPLPRSLATTYGISVDVFSSPYLDVSVQAVPLAKLWIHFAIAEYYFGWIAPFGYPRINAHLRLPVAFRSLSRPSSAPSAKAFPLRSL